MTMVGAMAAQWVAKRVMMNPPPPLTASTSSASTLISPWLPVVCGRGDRKTKKGKRFRGTYGNCRPKKDKKIERIKERVEVPPSTPWPLPFKLV